MLFDDKQVVFARYGEGNGRFSAKPLNSRLLNPGKLGCFYQHGGRGTAVSNQNYKRRDKICVNLPLLLANDTSHSQAEKRYYVLGQTNAGRQLFIAFTVRTNQIRVISARDMSRKERQKYAETNS